jgi:uncharacterized membrane protein YkvA (DUF1232 family)
VDVGVFRNAATVAGAARATNGRHPLRHRVAVVPRMLRDAFTGRWPGAPFGRLVGGLAGVLYVISPIDLMPEILLGPFGIGDDLALAAVAVAALLSSAEDYLDARADGTVGGDSRDHGAASYDIVPGVVIDRADGTDPWLIHDR